MMRFALGTAGQTMMTLAGYAGTGKTTLVGALLQAVVGSGKVRGIAVAAPTNKAVGVLRSKVGDLPGVAYGSIHSFLGLKLKERDDGTHECVPDGSPSIAAYDFVVVDECSMLSVDLFVRLAMLMRGSDVRVLFVGDPAQLPPVGDTEESPTFSRVMSRVTLTEVVRQAKGNPIIATSMRIREAIERGYRIDAAAIKAACPPPPADVLFATGGSKTAFNWALHDIRAGKDTRILAYTNRAVLQYNQDMHRQMFGFHPEPFSPGETVILNDGYDGARTDDGFKVDLFNSEECEVVSVHAEDSPSWAGIPAWQVRLRRDGGTEVNVWMPVDARTVQTRINDLFQRASRLAMELKQAHDSRKDQERRDMIREAWGTKNAFANLRHTYAMTIHKSQGSTIDTAIVDLTDVQKMRSDFDYNRALYVACTRAAKHLAFVI